MRLLSTSTLAIQEFFGQSIPQYAILSHRWEDEEVTFQDLQAGEGLDKKGFLKIEGCCNQAAFDGWEYVWIDSCCIDKTSSAELSEAINSMFEWYRQSVVCYVYLSDVPYIASEAHAKLHQSKWWTRGWTLQELIAPKHVLFYNCEWMEIGTKRSMEVLISSITGISREHLRNYAQASVAQKMSWASRRETTRKEDEAYCLMGIFNVHMPLLYGEGSKAFRRLQLEILANSDDESLLAWTSSWSSAISGAILAFSPAGFSHAGGIVRAEIDKNRPPFSMTNKGLRMELFLGDEASQFLAPLNCIDTQRESRVVALTLRKVKLRVRDGRDDEYHRASMTCHRYDTQKFQGQRTVVFLTDNEFVRAYRPKQVTFDIHTESLLRHGFAAVQKHICDHFETTETRQMSKSFEGLTVTLNSNDVCLKFTRGILGDLTSQSMRSQAENTDSFVLVLECDLEGRDAAAVNILITEENEPVEADIRKLLKTREWKRGLDRISKTMRSGTSVSAALRRRRLEGKLRHTVDLTIDPTGVLPWPDLG